MAIYDELIEALPELADSKVFAQGLIVIQDDSDGEGDYIAEWNYLKPLPKGFKLGK